MPDDITDESKNSPEKETPAIDGNTINQAVTAHLKRFAEKQLPALLEAQLKPLFEKIEAVSKAPPPKEDESGKKVDPEIAALKAKLDEQIAIATASEKARAAAEEKARNDKAFADFKGHLAKTVRPDMLDVVASHLFHIEKRVVVDPETGEATFKGVQTRFGITDEVAFPLKDGVENWAKSESAKPFLPAAGTSNTPKTTRATGIAASSLPQNMNFETASPQQRIQAAAEMEAAMQAALEQRQGHR